MLKITKKEKMYLQFLYDIFELRTFDPLRFLDDFEEESVEENIRCLFYEFLNYIDELGVSISINKCGDRYDITYIDFLSFDYLKDITPDYPAVKTYLVLSKGTALTKQDISAIFKRELSSNDINQLKKLLENKTCCKFIKRKDNSYIIEKGE